MLFCSMDLFLSGGIRHLCLQADWIFRALSCLICISVRQIHNIWFFKRADWNDCMLLLMSCLENFHAVNKLLSSTLFIFVWILLFWGDPTEMLVSGVKWWKFRSYIAVLKIALHYLYIHIEYQSSAEYGADMCFTATFPILGAAAALNEKVNGSCCCPEWKWKMKHVSWVDCCSRLCLQSYSNLLLFCDGL